MIDTYFYIQIRSEDEVWAEFGPYLDFTHAAKVFVDHCPYLLHSMQSTPPGAYDALIIECNIRNGQKEIINTKVQETRHR